MEIVEMPEVTDTLKTARKALEGLRDRRDQVETRAAEIASERESVAMGALLGDTAANDRLTALRAEKLQLDEQHTDLASAITQAERDVSAAQDALSAFDSREVAKRQSDQADALLAAAKGAEKALNTFVAEIAKLNAIATDLRSSGAMIVTEPHMRLMVERSIVSHLIEVRLAENTIAASERKTLTVLIGEYAKNARDSAQRQIAAANEVLGPEAPAAPAPAPQPAKEAA
jgi:hypothetical protein